MKTPRELHIRAMEVLSNANQLLTDGDESNFKKLLKEAFELEKLAARGLYSRIDAEPTRALLFRSAASLALQCGEMEEARSLIYAGLSGNPNVDLKEELEYLLNEYLDNKLVVETLKNEFTFLILMRDNALNFRVKPNKDKYSAAIVVDNILEFLQNLNSSWGNYIIINFKKTFYLLENVEELAGKIRNELPLLSVNQKFASFGVSISCDTRTMVNKGYNKDILAWQTTIFELFKTEVFLNNFNDSNHIRYLKEKYSPQERIGIFKKLVDTMKDGSDFQISLTNKSFSTIEKVFKPVSKIVKSELLPKIEILPQEQKETFVIEQFALADSIDGRITKKNIFQQAVLESGTWDYKTKDIIFNNQHLYLNDQLELSIDYQKPYFSITLVPIQLTVTATGYNEVLERFNENLINVYKSLKDKKQEELSRVDLEKISFFNDWVFSYSID